MDSCALCVVLDDIPRELARVIGEDHLSANTSALEHLFSKKVLVEVARAKGMPVETGILDDAGEYGITIAKRHLTLDNNSREQLVFIPWAQVLKISEEVCDIKKEETKCREK